MDYEWFSKWTMWVDRVGIDGDWIRRFLNKTVLSLIGEVGGLLVLDAGCGEGRFSRLLAERKARVIAIDIVPELLQLAKDISMNKPAKKLLVRWPWLAHRKYDARFAKNIRYKLANMTKLPRSWNSSFDVVVSYCSLNDTPVLYDAVASFSRVLKRRGVCVVVIPHPNIIRPRGTNHLPKLDTPFTEYISPKLKVTNYYRSLPQMLNAFAGSRLFLEYLEEPFLDRTFAYDNKKEIAELMRVRGFPHPSKQPWFLVAKFRKL